MKKLFKAFAGQFVNIVMKSIKGTQTTDHGSIQGNVVMSGFLLDEDETYFYLGKDQDKIDEALRKDDVVRIYQEEPEPSFDIFDFDDTGDRH